MPTLCLRCHLSSSSMAIGPSRGLLCVCLRTLSNAPKVPKAPAKLPCFGEVRSLLLVNGVLLILASSSSRRMGTACLICTTWCYSCCSWSGFFWRERFYLLMLGTMVRRVSLPLARGGLVSPSGESSSRRLNLVMLISSYGLFSFIIL